jgi:hypothetical protein
MRIPTAIMFFLCSIILFGCHFIHGRGLGSIKGWDLNGYNIGLAGAGLSADSLPPYTGPYNPKAGTIIREQLIETGLDLSAGDIIIERCAIRPPSVGTGIAVVNSINTQSNVTLRDCDIDGSTITDGNLTFAFYGCGIIERCNIFGTGSGIWLTGNLGVRAENNYIHNLRNVAGAHVDGFTIRSYRGPSAVILNNRIESYSGYDTGALVIGNDGGYIDNVLVEGNLLAGYGYNLLLFGNGPEGFGPTMQAINNRFIPDGFGVGYTTGGWHWLDWKENYLYDSSKATGRGIWLLKE